jgi:hypothetical protein
MAASSFVKMFVFSMAKTKITVKWFFDSQELVQYLGNVVHKVPKQSAQILVHCSSF